MLGKYFTKTFKDKFGEHHVDEKALKIKTATEWNEFAKSKFDAMANSWKADTHRLFKTERFSLVMYDKFKRSYSQWDVVDSKEPTNAVLRLANKALKHCWKDERWNTQRYVMTIVSKTGGPIWVSQDIKSKEMVSLIGYAISFDYMLPPKELYNKNIAAGSNADHFFALVEDETGAVTLKELPADEKAAISEFNSWFPAGNQAQWKFRSGHVGHHRTLWFRNAWKTFYPSSNWNHMDDTYALLAKYAQNTLGLYQGVKGLPEELGLETVNQVSARSNAVLEKLHSFATGGNGRLMQAATIGVTIREHKTGKVTFPFSNTNQRHYKDAVTVIMNQLHNKCFKMKGREDLCDYLVYLKRSDKIIACSEDDLKSDTARLLIGASLARDRIHLPLAMSDSARSNAKDKDRGYAVVARERDSKKFVKEFSREQAPIDSKITEIEADAKYDVSFTWSPMIYDYFVREKKTSLSGV